MNTAAQLTDEWFKQRVGRITGSRVGAILGLNPYQTADDVLRAMVREYHEAESEFTGNHFTRYGQLHEQDAINELIRREGISVVDAPLVVHPEFDWLAASPDGFTDDNGLVECKCPQSIKLLYQVPHYFAQMQLQMHCAGRNHCYFVQWTPEVTDIQVVYMDPAWLLDNIDVLNDFMNRYYETVNDPELSAPHLEAIEVERDDDDWQECADILREANEKMEVLKKQADEAKSRLIKMAGGRKSRGAGVLVFPVSGRKTIDYKTMLKDHPDIDISPYEKHGKETWSVRLS